MLAGERRTPSTQETTFMITIAIDTGAAPQSGSENIECTVPASKAAFQTAAATAVSSSGGFILVTVAPVDGKPAAEKLLNVSKIRAVI